MIEGKKKKGGREKKKKRYRNATFKPNILRTIEALRARKGGRRREEKGKGKRERGPSYHSSNYIAFPERKGKGKKSLARRGGRGEKANRNSFEAKKGEEKGREGGARLSPEMMSDIQTPCTSVPGIGGKKKGASPRKGGEKGGGRRGKRSRRAPSTNKFHDRLSL